MSLSFDFLYFQPRLIVERRPGLGTRLLTFESLPNLIKCCLFDFPWASNMLLAFSRKGIKSSTMAPLLMLLCHYYFWLSVTSLVKSKKFYTQDGMSTSSKPILKRWWFNCKDLMISITTGVSWGYRSYYQNILKHDTYNKFGKFSII